MGSFKHNSRNQVHFKFVIYRQLFHIDGPKEQEFRVKISNLELFQEAENQEYCNIGVNTQVGPFPVPEEVCVVLQMLREVDTALPTPLGHSDEV